MEFLIAVGSTIVGETAKNTVAPIGRHLGFLFHYKRKQEILEIRVNELNNAMTSLRCRVEVAQRKGEEAEEGLTEWREEAERLSERAKDFLREEMAKCAGVSLRYKIGREASAMARMVGANTEKANNFGLVFHRPILRSSFRNRDFEAFATTIQTRGKIIEALRDTDLGVIGIYGAGGIGKSTLVQEVARKVQEEELFSKVVIVTVSQTYNIHKIQQEIAEALGIVLHEQSEPERAKRLKHRLEGMQEKRVLIILDDVWEKLELSSFGIFFEGDKIAGSCKLLLVSRDRDVLWAHPDLNKEIEVHILSSVDSMLLFIRFVVKCDRRELESSSFKSLAIEIVAECGGLPIAIVTIASALRNKSLITWKDTLNRLRESPEEGTFKGKVFSTVRTSYDYLVQEEKLVKPLLLLCSLHGEDTDINIEELMTYVVGLDLFPYVNTLETARNRVGALIDRLKAHSLLGDGVKDGHVKMHDVIRDVVLSIAAKDEDMYCFTNKEKWQHYLEKENLDNSTAIVLHGPYRPLLPEKLTCPRLQLLLMFNSWDFRYQPMLIPEQCFEETKALKVLNFHRIKSLPSNFVSLQNLQTLRLRFSRFEDVSLIGKLKSLIILDLSDSSLKELPETIGQLTRLRQLNLNNCRDLHKIQPNVISKLVSLEELYIHNVSVTWETEIENRSPRRYANLVELQNLSRLRVLELSLTYTFVLPNNAFNESLENYIIEMGIWNVHVSGMRSRILKLRLRENCLEHQRGLQMLMKKSDVLFLHGTFRRVDNIFPQIDAGGFQGLKDLCIDHNSEIRHIVGTEHQIGKAPVFPSLETLTLRELKNLEKLLCQDESIESESFGQLKRIRLQGCYSLKRVFPFDILRKLEDITLESCSDIEEIVTYRSSNATDEGIELPRLKSLKLYFLPRLIHLFGSKFDAAHLSPSPNAPIPPLFNRQVSFPSLTDLELVGIKSSQFWGNQIRATSSSMQNLTYLVVEQCYDLRYIFPLEVAGALLHLEHIRVKDCSKIEEVVRATNKSPTTLVWPKLESVELVNLPSLKNFYALYTDSTPEPDGRAQEHSLLDEKLLLPCLTSLKVNSCGSVKCLFSYTISTSLPRLQTLEIQECGEMEEIVEERRSDERSDNYLFSALMFLRLSSLPTLKVFCSESRCDYQSLRDLTITSCPNLSERGKDEKNAEANDSCVVSLPKLLGSCGSDWKNLEKLTIYDCDNLECLFTSDEAKCLEKLNKLFVRRCKNMEDTSS